MEIHYTIKPKSKFDIRFLNFNKLFYQSKKFFEYTIDGFRFILLLPVSLFHLIKKRLGLSSIFDIDDRTETIFENELWFGIGISFEHENALWGKTVKPNSFKHFKDIDIMKLKSKKENSELNHSYFINWNFKTNKGYLLQRIYNDNETWDLCHFNLEKNKLEFLTDFKEYFKLNIEPRIFDKKIIVFGHNKLNKIKISVRLMIITDNK